MDLCKTAAVARPRNAAQCAQAAPRSGSASIGEWIEHLEHQRGGVEDSGARGLDRALGVLLVIQPAVQACGMGQPQIQNLGVENVVQS